MGTITLYILIGLSIAVWMFICLIIYKSSRTALWLAGSTVASCLFLLGATVAISFLVKRALFLAPLWFGVLTLSLLHLETARRNTALQSHYENKQCQVNPSVSIAEDSEKGVYI